MDGVERVSFPLRISLKALHAQSLGENNFRLLPEKVKEGGRKDEVRREMLKFCLN
jgi:hypothetical protein